MKTTVWVTTEFEAQHRWKDAPAEVDFLRNWHRHLFKVRVGVRVSHDNREVEFFMFKGDLNKYIKRNLTNGMHEKSCEQFAKQILRAMNATYVEVSEDGENGATVSAV